MSAPVHSRWLHRFAVFTAVATLCLIGLGGMVTSHGVGMAVPDWPNTYGYNMFLYPVSKWVGGILYEHSHRLLASAVGLLTTILAVWLWVRETAGANRKRGVGAMCGVILLLGVRQMPMYLALAAVALPVIAYGIYRFLRAPDELRWAGVAALAAVTLQGVLGGLRVVWFKDEIGIFHATLAQLFLVLVSVIAIFTSSRWQRAVSGKVFLPATKGMRRLLVGTTLLVLTQLILGATMRHEHAGLAVPDFPLAYGQIWPRTDAAFIELINQKRTDVREFNPIQATHIVVHMTHRITALLITIAVMVVALKLRRELGSGSPAARAGLAWVGLILVQATLGAITVWTNKAADIATLHVVTGAACLVLGALLTVTIYKFSFAVNPSLIHARGDLSVLPGAQPKTA